MREVVVVGAGPGGSATAYFLARAGVDVLLVDKAEFPRDKTCGDGLTPRALRVVEDMGVLPAVRAMGCQVQGYEVVAPNGKTTAAPIRSDDGALAVPRRELDEVLRRRAVEAGARFERMNVLELQQPTRAGVTVHGVEQPTSAGVTVRGAGRTVEARQVVVATGAATGLLLRSGMLRQPPKVMLAARAYFEGVSARASFQLRFDHVPLPGYGWVFPVGPDRVNVGVGFMPRRGRGTAAAAFERFVGRVLRGAQQVGPLKGYPIRVDFLRAPTFSGQTLLVGEAAGLVNPLTGEGIDYALESGAIAASHILRQARPEDYDQALRARFGKLFRFSEVVRDWYCIPPVLNLLVPLASTRPELRQLLTDIVLGERQPAGYGPATMAGRLLLYLLRTRRPSRSSG